MPKLDITTQTRHLDALIETLDNPLHRKIISNYRRHAILEITGNATKIFTPDMTVENPVYYLNIAGQSVTLNGRDEVYTFYSSLERRESGVIVVTDEKIAVADWGFASEATFNSYMRGSEAPEQFDADPDKLYIHRTHVAMIWPYDEQGRMIGEHVYQHEDFSRLIEVPEEEYITLDEAREKLLPLLKPLPELTPARA
ncbi:hypothetical protein [Streptomyces sp. Y7]|uniref:hypothetical protein n=1 Tax=Streptomyces sp. Y7 TaxID=3342392 RepID=UPI00371AEA22